IFPDLEQNPFTESYAQRIKLGFERNVFFTAKLAFEALLELIPLLLRDSGFQVLVAQVVLNKVDPQKDHQDRGQHINHARPEVYVGVHRWRGEASQSHQLCSCWLELS